MKSEDLIETVVVEEIGKDPKEEVAMKLLELFKKDPRDYVLNDITLMLEALVGTEPPLNLLKELKNHARFLVRVASKMDPKLVIKLDCGHDLPIRLMDFNMMPELEFDGRKLKSYKITVEYVCWSCQQSIKSRKIKIRPRPLFGRGFVRAEKPKKGV